MAEHVESKKYIWMVLIALTVMTILELLLPAIQGMRNFVIFGLILLALAKAACVLIVHALESRDQRTQSLGRLSLRVSLPVRGCSHC